MKANGKMDNFMAEVHSPGVMARNMLGDTSMVKSMALVDSFTLQERCMKENGAMASRMARALYSMLMKTC